MYWMNQLCFLHNQNRTRYGWDMTRIEISSINLILLSSKHKLTDFWRNKHTHGHNFAWVTVKLGNTDLIYLANHRQNGQNCAERCRIGPNWIEAIVTVQTQLLHQKMQPYLTWLRFNTKVDMLGPKVSDPLKSSHSAWEGAMKSSVCLWITQLS